MSMNFIDAAGVLADSADVAYHDLEIDPDIVNIDDLIAAYDALAPDWSQAPDDAKLNTIDSAGARFWHRAEPSIIRLGWESGTATWAGFVDIPIGLDWRLLKWQRPEVAA